MSVTAANGNGALGFETVLSDAHGRRSQVAVQQPREWTRDTGVLIGLHGAGGSGATLLPVLAPLAERANLVIVCPTAAVPAEEDNNLDLAGLMGRRFAHPRWQATEQDFPLQALDWAVKSLGATPRRAVMLGYSMGAVAAWSFGLRFAHRFSGLVAISGALSMWERFGPDRQTDAMLPNLLGLPVFALHGGADTQFPPDLMHDAARRLAALNHDQIETHLVEGAGHALQTLDLRPGAPHYEALGRWLARVPARGDAAEEETAC